ncbi:hypothetical protein [Sorangium sp. So ce1182]|uniref:hypothetical protein n=1 Tax=Sorangium sp. So ce1182 TaxID=3133334 RepID=UPI003F645D10
MREETRRAALRAAARVALGALACGVSVGCGGVHISDEQAPAPDPGEQVVPEAPDGPDPAGTGAAAGGAGAAGGGGAAPGPGGDVSASSAAGGGTDGAGGSPSDPSELACAEQAGLDDAEARPRAELECCVDYTTQRLPEGAVRPSEQQLAALAEDASFVNCCTALIVGVGANAISYREAEPIRHACCFGDVVALEQELYAYTFCTPWGPPVPPALDADAASEVA